MLHVDLGCARQITSLRQNYGLTSRRAAHRDVGAIKSPNAQKHVYGAEL